MRALTTPALALTTAVALTTTLAAWGAGGALGASGHPARTVALGSPGHWNKVSNGSVSTTNVPSLVRTSDGVLHVVYAKAATDGMQIGHATLSRTGSVTRRTNVLAAGWSVLDPSPVVVSGDGTALRVMFAGQQTQSPGYWSNGRIYDATSSTGGASWILPQEGVGWSTHAIDTSGTAGTTTSDGTPVAGFPQGDTYTWHVGTGYAPDQTYQTTPQANCCLFSSAMTRDGDAVWAAWYQNGWTEDGDGTLVKQLYPTVGATLKAPGSSVGTNSLTTGRVALASRVGGGTFLAYCTGYPTCTGIRLWKVGTNANATVPHSQGATHIALSAGPGGRLWVAWSDATNTVHAMRTDATGLGMGAVQTAGIPKHGEALGLAIEGSRSRGDIVLNDGRGIWHTQVLPGLTPKASKTTWKAHHKQKVVFSVRDAKHPVKGAKVRIGSRHCKTSAKGTCSITFPASYAKGKHRVRITKPAYGTAVVVVRVR